MNFWPILYIISLLLTGCSSYFYDKSEESEEYMFCGFGSLTIVFWMLSFWKAKKWWIKLLWELSLVAAIYCNLKIGQEVRMLVMREYLQEHSSELKEVRSLMLKSDHYYDIYDLMNGYDDRLTESEIERLKELVHNCDLQAVFVNNKTSFDFWLHSDAYLYYNEEPHSPRKDLRYAQDHYWIY
jgi:hypothetical protein